MNHKEKLNSVQLKATPTRLALLELIEKEPVSVKQLQKSLPKSTVSTLYRCLNLLCDKGILERVTVEGQPHFQLNSHKHYIVCKSCHKLQPLPICPIKDELTTTLMRESGFLMTEHKLELYGYCKECAKKE